MGDATKGNTEQGEYSKKETEKIRGAGWEFLLLWILESSALFLLCCNVPVVPIGNSHSLSKGFAVFRVLFKNFLPA